ncbi:MAG: hypothetical protein JNK82_14845 [Myxococcaceae bacterium]|nr:hypothetical protein [Myxococcaceae bacterium]
MATQTLTAGSERGWDGVLWVVQAGLAGMFGVAGTVRAFEPISSLREGRLHWADASNEWWLRGSGYALMFVALALLLPGLIKLGERLVPMVATAMTLACVVSLAGHLIHRMPERIVEDVFIAATCGFVAWGRVFKTRV